MRKNVLVLTYWSYAEGLIQSSTLPYLKILSTVLGADAKIFLVTLEKSGMELTDQQAAEEAKILSRWNIELIREKYTPFGLKALGVWIWIVVRLAVFIVSKKITHLHPFCTPPAMFGYMLAVLTGRPLIIDSYEPHAESMAESGAWSRSGFAYKILFFFEKLQTKRADYLVGLTAGMREYARLKYGVEISPARFFVRSTCVDFDLFSLEKRKNLKLMTKLGLNNKVIGVYAGKTGGIYLDDEFFAMIKVAANFWGKERFRLLWLSNQAQEQIEEKLKQNEIDRSTVIQKFIPHRQMADYLGLADFAYTPVKPVPAKKYCAPIKDGEYWAMGLPVIIPAGISGDADIIARNGIGHVLEKFNEAAYLSAYKHIDDLIRHKDICGKIRAVAKRYRSFTNVEAIYRHIYTSKSPL